MTESAGRRAKAREWRRRVAAADARALARLSGLTGRSRALDGGFTRLGAAADRSRLWLGIAAVLSLVGGRRGRRSAVHGLAGVALASTSTNALLKFLWRRPRPALLQASERPRVVPPGSFSFPSGHSASAAAFAVAVARQWPAMGIPVGAAAAGVAYSRVHTRVHYPGDVLAGIGMGVAAALATDRLLARRDSASPAPVEVDALPRVAVLLTSPHAGSAHWLDRTRAALVAAGLTIEAELTVLERDRLAALVGAHEHEPLLVVAAGGDGTVGAAADAVAGTQAVLGVLPLGTSNDLARSLGISTRPLRAAALLTAGKVATIDAGRLVTQVGPDRHFVHAATAGVNVGFARHATQAATRERFGRLAYTVAAIKTLRERETFSCTLLVDGTRHQLELVHLSVVNAPVFAGPFELMVPGVDLDDRLLDVIAVEHLALPRLVVSGLMALVVPHRPLRGLHRFRGQRVQVHTSEPLELTLDGEIAGRLPATFELAAEAIRVVTPHEFVDIDDPA